jgi:hypothetical protein
LSGHLLSRTTHTFCTLQVSKATFTEITRLLLAADYVHAFHQDGATIDMHGLALVEEEQPK